MQLDILKMSHLCFHCYKLSAQILFTTVCHDTGLFFTDFRCSVTSELAFATKFFPSLLFYLVLLNHAKIFGFIIETYLHFMAAGLCITQLFALQRLFLKICSFFST